MKKITEHLKENAFPYFFMTLVVVAMSIMFWGIFQGKPKNNVPHLADTIFDAGGVVVYAIEHKGKGYLIAVGQNSYSPVSICPVQSTNSETNQ
jgi:deoxyxylulose-5-phosphate synthase